MIYFINLVLLFKWMFTLYLILLMGLIVSKFISIIIIHIERKNSFNELNNTTFFMGVLEFIMFTISIYSNAASFIFLWMGVKTALRWDRKTLKAPQEKIHYGGIHEHKTEKQEKKEIEAEHLLMKKSYLRFLIGNALLIIFSFILASILKGEIIISNNK